MLFIQTEPPPPPPPPSQRAYKTFLPIVQSMQNHICIAIEGQYESRCDYVKQDDQGRWFVWDEGIYNEFTLQPYFSINGYLYGVISHDNGETLPDDVDSLDLLEKNQTMFHVVYIVLLHTFH